MGYQWVRLRTLRWPTAAANYGPLIIHEMTRLPGQESPPFAGVAEAPSAHSAIPKRRTVVPADREGRSRNPLTPGDG